MYNPYLPEPQLQSTMLRTGVPQPPNLLANGWEPLVIPPSTKAVIPGVSTNAVGKNYRVSHKIGMGSFGEIFLGVDIRTNERVAIKVETRTTKYPQLLDEYAVYRAVAKGVGVPSAIWCGSNANVHIMVMDLLGDSLETLYNNCNRKFSLKTITMLAIQLLHRIEHHHNHHYLHRDIKPDNFLMGPPQSTNAHILYMVDMGLCKKYRDDATLNHIPYRENKKLIGTPRYASINTHLGIEQCRRDDLESIGYMLIYFFAGRLPWQGLKAKCKQEKYDKISQAKINITTAELCKGAPLAFKAYLDYCRQLRFTQKPDYKYLRSLFYDLFRANGWQDDCIYDWMLPKGVAPEPTPARGVVVPPNIAVAAPVVLPSPSQQHTAAAAQSQYIAAQHQAQQQAAIAGTMMSHFMYNAAAAAAQAQAQQQTTPSSLSRAPTPQQMSAQQQNQNAIAYMMQGHQQQQQQQQQAAAAYLNTPRVGSTTATPKATTPAPSPPAVTPVDPSHELRRKLTEVERQVSEQRGMSNEWRRLYEKALEDTRTKDTTIAKLKEELELTKQELQRHINARSSGGYYANGNGTTSEIPLASAASLKRRRGATTSGANADDGTDEDEASAKKTKKR